LRALNEFGFKHQTSAGTNIDCFERVVGKARSEAKAPFQSEKNRREKLASAPDEVTTSHHLLPCDCHFHSPFHTGSFSGVNHCTNMQASQIQGADDHQATTSPTAATLTPTKTLPMMQLVTSLI
jgi:hypothetical protein